MRQTIQVVKNMPTTGGTAFQDALEVNLFRYDYTFPQLANFS